MNTLVVPCHRADLMAEWLRAWDGPAADWDELIVVEDGPARTFDLPPGAVHASWAEIAADAGADAAIFSRRDSAIRCYGFLLAYRRGATLIGSLDSDCFPADDRGFFARHRTALDESPRWTPSIPEVRTRGLPYANFGRLGRVAVSMGLWSRVADLDAVTSLADLGQAALRDFRPPAGTRVMPRGQYFPFCGMNNVFRREVCPLMYYPPMGEGSPFARMDDLWAGLVWQRACDHLGYLSVVGEPHVVHQRASDPFVNLVKEAPGIPKHEWFWEAVDAVPLTGRSPQACVLELGEGLARHEDEYLARWGRSLLAWLNLFD